MRNGNNTIRNINAGDLLDHSRTGYYTIQTNYDAEKNQHYLYSIMTGRPRRGVAPSRKYYKLCRLAGCTTRQIVGNPKSEPHLYAYAHLFYRLPGGGRVGIMSLTVEDFEILRKNPSILEPARTSCCSEEEIRAMMALVS